jgi:hypothetical protein
LSFMDAETKKKVDKEEEEGRGERDVKELD